MSTSSNEIHKILIKMKIIFYCLMLSTLVSCNMSLEPDIISEKEKKLELEKAQFDNTIIANFEKYKELNAFLQTNLNAIITYRFSNHKVILVHGKSNGQDSVYLGDEECYAFYDSHPNEEFLDVPDNLKSKVSQLLSLIGKDNILLYEVCKNGKISITVKQVDKKNGLYILHSLIWNIETEKKFQDNETKDSTIDNNCIYRISLYENYGR